MNNKDQSLLLAFNQEDTSLPAVRFGIWLAEQISVPVSLLGVIEHPSQQKRVELLLEEFSAAMQAAKLQFQANTLNGDCPQVILQQADRDQHLAVFGPFNRPPLTLWLRGRSFRRILEKIETPVLYVKQPRDQINRILLCMGGLGYASSAESWALYFARLFSAALTILHVVEPVSFEYPTAIEIQEHWEQVLETDTPQGENLRQAIEGAEKAGVSTDFKVRHGEVIHEISGELRAEEYDLLVMGSAASSNKLRHLYLPNITAEIAESVDCPVLAVKFGQDCIF